jgi:S1-C subfamily serine protease
MQTQAQEQYPMDTLKTVSNEMAALVETVGAGVVQVNARKRMPASGVVMREDGVIATSHHVVTRDENIHVTLPNGDKMSATLVGRDPSTDLAILKVDASGLTVPNWVTSDNAKVGHLVLALGRPGKTVQATLGVVSALGEGWQSRSGGTVDRYFQTDVVMYPGFSGGPLAGADGAVYGLNTSALMRGTSLTIPTETVLRVGEALMEHGHIKRGYLGVTAQTVRLQESIIEEAGQETGLLVASVADESPAAVGGVLQGDILLMLGDNRVRSMEELLSQLSGSIVGGEVGVQLVRGGAIQSVTVTVGERQ